jgi:hypothetical protein
VNRHVGRIPRAGVCWRGGIVYIGAAGYVIIDRAAPSGWWALPVGQASPFVRLLVSKDTWRLAPECRSAV